MQKIPRINLFYVIIIFILFLSITEIGLREYLGFGNAILFKEDPYVEYIPVPQSKQRFGHNNVYNSFSQRNREVLTTDSTVILGFGDSILNGGALTDQDSLATTMLSSYLSKKYKKDVLFTNISAGSWGPDNCYAYLKKYGNFRAKGVLLVVSSHDAYDNMTFEKIVGIHPNYPNTQYHSAICEVLVRYIYYPYIKDFFTQKERVTSSKTDQLLINKYKRGANFNNGFSAFKSYCDSAKIPLTIYLHADISELRFRRYNAHGQLIIEFCESNKIRLVKELDYNMQPQDYRDNIHLSHSGQRKMFDILKTCY
ncbi:hypothetical protein GCM10011375_35810 [Hymenobacter qilianensis]|uniref:Uncharacterized protein n=2 Tax=Hymenobacter qilianensis TaxID=1385715 RepID=A0ACB5PW02_9BACT|nr:hypothetical protein GCM10011375_35810 [Hymenobacter qilianensis]